MVNRQRISIKGNVFDARANFQLWLFQMSRYANSDDGVEQDLFSKLASAANGSYTGTNSNSLASGSATATDEGCIMQL